jgi:Flp pilus assembly pilin Flp
MRRTGSQTQSALRRALKDRSGATAVEFAIVVPIFLLLVMAIFYVAFTYYVATRVERAAFVAQERIRYADSRPANIGQVRSLICDQLNQLIACGRIIIHVAPLSQVPVGAGSPTSNSYNVIANEAAILRIVSPPSPLVRTMTSFLRIDPARLEVRANVFFHVRS